MRPIEDVVRTVLAVVPDPEVRAEMEEATRPILESARYTATESMNQRWAELGRALGRIERDHGGPAAPWSDLTRSIFCGTVDYQEYLPKK